MIWLTILIIKSLNETQTGQFIEADAVIDGNTVVVYNKKIKQPVQSATAGQK